VNAYDLFCTHKFSNIRDFRWFVVNEGTLVLNPTIEKFKDLRYGSERGTELLSVMGGQKVMLS